MKDKYTQAVEEYINRARGDAFPEGEYLEDNRFEPYPTELCPMCVTFLTREDLPFEFIYVHCLTWRHIALKYKLDPQVFEYALAKVLGITSLDTNTRQEHLDLLAQGNDCV